MKNIKRRFALFLALIMVFNLVVMFSQPMHDRVLAAPGDGLPLGTTGVQGGVLRSSFHSTLTAVPGQNFPHLNTVTTGSPIASENSVMLNWPLVTGPNRGMYLLRFFDAHGRRHELSVIPMTGGDGTSGFMVNFDIYDRLYNAANAFVGYQNINDPVRPLGQTGHFSIYFPGTNAFEPVNTWFANQRNGVRDVMSGAEHTGVNMDRVNNRGRFPEPTPTPPAPIPPPPPFTPTRPEYPMNWNDFICHHTGDGVANPLYPQLPLIPNPGTVGAGGLPIIANPGPIELPSVPNPGIVALPEMPNPGPTPVPPLVGLPTVANPGAGALPNVPNPGPAIVPTIPNPGPVVVPIIDNPGTPTIPNPGAAALANVIVPNPAYPADPGDPPVPPTISIANPGVIAMPTVPNPGIGILPTIVNPGPALIPNIINPGAAVVELVPNPGVGVIPTMDNPGPILLPTITNPGELVLPIIPNPGENLLAMVPNPGPAVLPYVPNPLYPQPEYIAFATDFVIAHNQRLTPSFNISEGNGFSFRYGGSDFHFLWVDGQFYFYAEGVLSDGVIHEFELEYRSFADTFTTDIDPLGQLGQTLDYFTNDIALDVLGAGVAGHVRRGHVYVFTGIDRNAVRSMPIGLNRAGGALVPHTIPHYMSLEGALLEPGSPQPTFNTNNLNMMPRPYQIYPAVTPSPEAGAVLPGDPNATHPAGTNGSVGMSMHFNLPTLFDENVGRFVQSVMLYPNLVNELDIRMDVRVGGARTIEDFIVDFDLSAVPNYPATGPSSLIQENNPRLANNGVVNVSRLQRTGQNAAQADRVRVYVGGLAPSIAYEEVFIMVRSSDTLAANVNTGFLSWPETRVATPVNPFYTFLRYTFVEIVGRPTIRIEPFNFSVGRIRTGFYMLESPQPPGFMPQQVTAALQHVYFPVPTMLVNEDREFWITKFENNPVTNPGGHALRSQIVVWGPDRTASIGVPQNFEVLNVNVRPIQGDMHAGHLTYSMRWDIGTWRDLRDLLDDGNGALELVYMIGLSTTPETMATHPDHRYYMRIPMEIRNGATTVSIPGAPAGENSNFPWPEVRIGAGEFLPLHVSGQANPIGNYGEWFNLGHRMDPRTGEVMFYITVDIRTQAVRRYRPAPPPYWMRDDFEFPGLYFMNARLDDWVHIVNGTRNPQVATVTWSTFDYIVIDDISELAPPPPSDLRVVAPVDRFGPPELHVSYNIPLAALRTYINTIYEVGVQPTVNWYIGQYESALLNRFFSGLEGNDSDSTHSLHPSLRPTTVAINIPFEDVAEVVTDPDTGEERIEITLTDAHTRILRGETAHENAVIRITDVPIIRTHLASPAAGRIPLAGINYPGWNCSSGLELDRVAANPANLTVGPNNNNPRLNYSIREFEQLLGLDLGRNLVTNPPRAVLPQQFVILGLDTNARYFVFADLQVEKWLEGYRGTRDGAPAFIPERDPVTGARTAYWQPHRDVAGNIIPPATSQFTGIVAATTTGEVWTPGPDMVHPPAPENIGARDIGEMEATVYWDLRYPAPANAENTRYEWEIIRILEGTRLTPHLMTAFREYDLPRYIQMLLDMTADEDLEFLIHDLKGWITDEESLEVLRWTAAQNNITTTFIEDPSTPVAGQTQRYAYDPLEVALTDFTLLPNNLYFFYVRTVRITERWDEQLQGYVLTRSYSVWVEQPVTTSPIQPPMQLREEPGALLRPTFDPQTQILVSWRHTEMTNILQHMGSRFVFRYQIRYLDEEWGEILTVPVSQMVRGNLDPDDPTRVRYLLTNLSSGSIFEMRVQLHDVQTGDSSLWSNIIVMVTEPDQQDIWVEDETDGWLNYMRRRLAEVLRRPYWVIEDTPDRLRLVYRPYDVFAGFMMDHPGTALPLHNTGAAMITYYMPSSNIRDANANRRGFITSYDDIQFQMAPSFLDVNFNQPLMDMARQVNNMMSDVTDSFIRMDLHRQPVPGISIYNVPSITQESSFRASIIGTNRNTRNIRTWDTAMHTRASQIIERRVSDPVLRVSIREMLLDGWDPEEISVHIYRMIADIEAEVSRAVAADMRSFANGILSTEQSPIMEFDAPMHVVATNARNDMFVTGYQQTEQRWIPQPLIEHNNGQALISRAPGTFAFTGRTVNIPGIVEEVRGDVITTLAARYGLEDFLGLNVDLQQNATRQMLAGSIASMAGAPRTADPIAWMDSNLNVNMSSRNANALVSRQEAIAMVMALYEHRTNTNIDSFMIRNFQQTAHMTLDARYAQAVRVAFELGLITDYELNPAGPISIGEFLNMLATLDARVPL